MTLPDPGRSHHDMGGLPAAAVVPAEHDYAMWEKRVDALLVLLSNRDKPLVSTDELRRNIESLGSESYERMSYYERWIFAIAQTLIERGVLTVDELGRKIERICARESAHE
jgi:Nitrile hydratase beta subunit